MKLHFRPFYILTAIVILSLGLQSVFAGDATPTNLAAYPVPARLHPVTAATAQDQGDFKLGPSYTNAPELTGRTNVPRGKVQKLIMHSEESKIYPGIRGPYQRGVWVYVPAQYNPGRALPFILVQDGGGYTSRLPVILDNLIAKHEVPVMAAIMINSGGGDGQGSERGLEYDTLSGKYCDFVETEVLPRVEQECGLILTKNPDGRATMGGSSGAACAFTMAWFRPDLYRRVLSYSGTFVNQQSPVNPASPRGAWEYHETLIPQSAAKPIRIWMQVGDRDLGYNKEKATLHNWVLANELMAAALKAKGYKYRYIFCEGAGHVDKNAVNETLPDALRWLWTGYQEEH